HKLAPHLHIWAASLCMMRKRHPAGKLIAIVLQTLIAVVVASQMCTAVSKSQDNGILLTGRSSLYGLTNCRLMAQG
ncbi:hypothetical protein ACQUFE_18685, partial [Enterococcus casseliflavus]|uniref:hypothetical protein n=1 Tax=Enterococcus casseliflavus TaxID=37734 RepID=UPI003D0BE7A5